MITCFTALMEVYLYAWPAQYMDDMVKIVYMYIIIYINYLQKRNLEITFKFNVNN